MPTIHLTTFIPAPVEIVFDLSRSISVHKVAMDKYNEQAVGGITAGLINKDETVTWKAKHLFKTRFFMSRITEMQPYEKFTDKMIKGDFKSFEHEHYFKSADNGTILIDVVRFTTPYGWIGHLVNRFYLTDYLEKLLVHRNNVIKQYATTEKGRALLGI